MDCAPEFAWSWLQKEKKWHTPRQSKKMVCGAEFLRISQLSSKQKHTCQHHYHWLGLFLAAWLFCYSLMDQHSTLLPVEDLTASKGVWCFDLSSWLPLALI